MPPTGEPDNDKRLKVFLSYGRDRETLVARVAQDLEAAGYEPWIDRSAIKPDDPWRHRIMEGLQACHWTLAFLSEHAMRPGGVCREEIGIALHTKGGAISLILVDDPAVATPVPSLADFQMIDKRDWDSIAAAPDPFDTDWYRDLMAQILTLLSDPEKLAYTQHIHALAEWLDPMEQAADLPSLLDGFVGREWLRDEVDRRRRSPEPVKLIWITAAPGSGKSAFSAWLAYYRHANVTGINLCAFNSNQRRDPVRILRTLAFRLAVRLPDYRQEMLALHAFLARTNRNLPGDPDDLFDLLFPRRAPLGGGRQTDRFLLTIDGLDETLRGGKSEIASLLARKAKLLPDWLAIVATCRPHTPIDTILSAHDPLRLDAAEGGHAGDLRIYARGWLAQGRSQAETERLTDKVVDAAGGAFLYLRMLHDAVDKGWMDLNDPAGLPRGLRGIYQAWFERDFPDTADYEARYVPIMEILTAARQPVPVALLASIRGWDRRQQAQAMHGLGSLFVHAKGRVAPFHQSLRDWLNGRLPEAEASDHPLEHVYIVDDRKGSRVLADRLWDDLIAALGAPADIGLDGFAMAELPVHLARQPDTERRARATAAGGWYTIRYRIIFKIEYHQGKFHWNTTQDWITLLIEVAGLFGDDVAQSWAFDERGAIYATNGETTSAIEAFRAGMAIRERLARQDPDNTQWQRDLSISHERIGDVQVAQGDLPGALQAFRAGMAISERLARLDSRNAGWQRDVLVSLTKLAGVAAAAGDRAEAIAQAERAVALARELVERFPGNPQHVRDLPAVEAMAQRLRGAGA